MNTQPNPPFKISARYLGPVFGLEAELTKHPQNLIFARNGMGKSFLSRAFRYLDLHQQSNDISRAAFNLVSDEASDGKGNLSLFRGTDALGQLLLERKSNTADATVSETTIFHVFSEDYVSAELREREYKVDGEITNEIAVDSDNIKLKELAEDVKAVRENHETKRAKLIEAFEDQKLEQLNKKAAINKQLKEYKNLDLTALLQTYSEKPDKPEKSLNELVKDLDALKSIPSEPNFPVPVQTLVVDQLDVADVNEQLSRETSPSSISSKIKAKIDMHHKFFETGAALVKMHDLSTCPFCEQSITSADPKLVIDAYIEYFEDEEEKHKSALRNVLQQSKTMQVNLTKIKLALARQRTRYDDLKVFIPSKKGLSLQTPDQALDDLELALTDINNVIGKKMASLASALPAPTANLGQRVLALCNIIDTNNGLSESLKSAVEKTDNERKELQRKACHVFGIEFLHDNWKDIEVLQLLEGKLKTVQKQLTDLEKSGPSIKARDRVADTFGILLKDFFGERYVFEKDSFTLKRGDKEMVRGPHRTLSDGEKTAIAFCYFIAAVHRKVTANSDYKKLFLVFDDPVTSMSYDYVFTIAQTLKNLNISKQGKVSVNPSTIDGNKSPRPNLLVLTHSGYFFNVARANAVVKPEATFSLSNLGEKHDLRHLEEYVAPFEQQLEHVYRVAGGRKPDYSTGNCIRSVLEAVGRFCRPDKTSSVQEFITFLAGEDGIVIKSALINSMCHGTYYGETPTPEDVTLACKEAINVVARYAKGHIEVLKKSEKATAS